MCLKGKKRDRSWQSWQVLVNHEISLDGSTDRTTISVKIYRLPSQQQNSKHKEHSELLTSFVLVTNLSSCSCKDFRRPSLCSSWPFRHVLTKDKNGWFPSKEMFFCRYLSFSFALFTVQKLFPVSSFCPAALRTLPCTAAVSLPMSGAINQILLEVPLLILILLQSSSSSNLNNKIYNWGKEFR